MKFLPLLLLLITLHSHATKCGGCIKNYDIVASIEIVGINEQYEYAFEAKIEKLQSFTNNYDVDETPETIVIIASPFNYKLTPLQDETEHDSSIDESMESERSFESVRRSMASKGRGSIYAFPAGFKIEVGDRIHFFGTQIEENIYSAPICSCSLLLEQDPLLTSGSSDGTAQSAAP